MLTRHLRELERQADVIEQYAKGKRLTKEDFECVEGMYYIGNVVHIDGSLWVNEETLELIIEEINNGVK